MGEERSGRRGMATATPSRLLGSRTLWSLAATEGRKTPVECLAPFRERVWRSGASGRGALVGLGPRPRAARQGLHGLKGLLRGGRLVDFIVHGCKNGVQGARHPRHVLELRTRPRRRRSELYPMLLSHGFSSNSFRIFSATSNSMVPCSRSQLIHQINLRDNYDVIPLALLVWAPSTCVYMNW